MSVPLTLYSPDGARSRQIAAIDAPGWIGKGWLKEPPDQILQGEDALNLPPSASPIASTQSPEPTVSVVIDSAASSTLGASETQTNKRGKV